MAEEGGSLFEADTFATPRQETDYSEADREAYLARKVAEGYRLVYPEANQLQIDIDDESDYNRFWEARSHWEEEFTVKRVYDEPSSSGLPHRHIVLELPFELESEWQRIALQMSFGSDIYRETFNLRRLQQGMRNVCVFLEKP